jgi:hypothetical protein
VCVWAAFYGVEGTPIDCDRFVIFIDAIIEHSDDDIPATCRDHD